MKWILLVTLCIFRTIGFTQNQPDISTVDIDRFWEAYDKLPDCTTQKDSINTFQVNYIDKASEGFKVFLKVRNFTAKEYYLLTKKYPKFWRSIRTNTLQIKNILGGLEKIYNNYGTTFPRNEQPKICFAIGGLRTGGTVADRYLLIGADIVAADKTTDKSELNKWLKTVLTDEFEVMPMVAHEYVHALQKTNVGTIWAAINHRVLMQCLHEGAADFLAEKVTGITINKHIYEYGHVHEAEIWAAFKKDMWGKNTNNWLYQGPNTKNGEPADLGYFVGYKICESYYNKAKDKQKALKEILVTKNYKRLYKKSGYGEKFE